MDGPEALENAPGRLTRADANAAVDWARERLKLDAASFIILTLALQGDALKAASLASKTGAAWSLEKIPGIPAIRRRVLYRAQVGDYYATASTAALALVAAALKLMSSPSAASVADWASRI